MKPLVTIITPAYNCEKYIEETIKNVLDNGYDNIQYIFLDDGSKDNTIDIMAGYEFGEPKFKGYCHRNSGEQITINRGLAMVRGKYFMIVNADDPLLPGAIEKLVTFMEFNPEVLCGYPDWRSIGEDGETRRHVKSREYDFEWMVNHHTCIPSVGGIFRSSILETGLKRDTSYRWLGDFKFWLDIGKMGPMARMPEELACWRHRDGQASADKSDARAREHIRIAKDFGEEARCWSYIVAAAVTDKKYKMVWYLLNAFLDYPQIIFKLHFWDALIKRAIHILRR